MTTPDPTQPRTPADLSRERAILRWAADRLDAMQVFTGEESRTLLRGWADELDAAPAACGNCGGTGCAEHPLVPTTICEDCKGTGEGEPPPVDSAPAVYALPAEPPETVTELWDRHGDRWLRLRDRWQMASPAPGATGVFESARWIDLLGWHGPLSTTPPAGTEADR